jgi:hypothetical protein
MSWRAIFSYVLQYVGRVNNGALAFRQVARSPDASETIRVKRSDVAGDDILR